MFRNRPLSGATIGVVWIIVSALYYGLVLLPPALNVITNLACCFIAVVAIATLSEEQKVLKVYIVAFSAAVGLSSLQISTSQPPFSPDFLVFLTLHLSILGAFIGAASLVSRADSADATHYAFASVANSALLIFIAIGLYVALVKGVRLSSFLEGTKIGGDAYKISGLSGIQGVLSIFLLCCFSMLSPARKFLFLSAVVAFAILDVKRGEFVRVALFVMFFTAIVSPKPIAWVLALGAAIFGIFIIGGEIRQGLYMSGFSASDLIRSRIDNDVFAWFYGYFGITVSVLQEHFNARTAAPGYFPMMLSLALNTSPPQLANLSIHGFNAGTAFSLFAGQGSIIPSLDFLSFCALFGLMVGCARWLGTPSMMAFVLLQAFGFVFGNYLQLPYYLVGFFLAFVYQAMLPTSSVQRAA